MNILFFSTIPVATHDGIVYQQTTCLTRAEVVHDDLRFPSVFVLSLPTKGDESITKNSQDCVDPNHMREFYQKFHGADDSTEDSLLCLKNMIGPHQISNVIEEGRLPSPGTYLRSYSDREGCDFQF